MNVRPLGPSYAALDHGAIGLPDDRVRLGLLG